MSESLDFSTLTTADALDLAVLIEEEARQRYFEFVDLMDEVHHDADTARFFAFLADSEERHGQTLWRWRERSYPDAPHRVTASMLFDADTPAYDTPTASMSPEDCLRAALETERQMETFFRDVLRAVGEADIRGFFLELAEEEAQHQKLVTERLAGLTASLTAPQRARVAEEVASD